MKKPNFKNVRIAVYSAVIITASIFTVYAMGYRYNTTESMPVGFYKKVDEAPKVGSIVQFCPPVYKKYDFMPAGFCGHNEAEYIKQIIAVPGDVVEVFNNGVYINGKYVENSTLSTRQDLPKAYGRYKLKDGEYWTFGSGMPKSSFDSRYFGIVKIEKMTVLKKV